MNKDIKVLLEDKKNSIFKSKKKVKAKIRLHLEVAKASPAPPVGPALSQHKVKNIMDFCKNFNAATKDRPAGTKLPVDVFVFSDGSVDFKLLKPSVSNLIKQALGIDKGSSKTGRDKPVASITEEQVRAIAEDKFVDMNAFSVEAAMNIIKGSLRSMGLAVVEQTNTV